MTPGSLVALIVAEAAWCTACVGLGAYRRVLGTNRGLYCSVEDWGDPIVAVPILVTWGGGVGVTFYFFRDMLRVLRARRAAAGGVSPASQHAVQETTVLGLMLFLNVFVFWGLTITSLVVKLLGENFARFPGEYLPVEFEMAAGIAGKLKPMADALVFVRLRGVHDSALIQRLLSSSFAFASSVCHASVGLGATAARAAHRASTHRVSLHTPPARSTSGSARWLDVALEPEAVLD